MSARSRCIFMMGLLFAATLAAATPATDRWDFRVLLDGKEIGSHHFVLTDGEGARRLTSEARFEVGFLFFTAYRYRHNDVETWRNGCLQSIEATTVTNGEETVVSGKREEGAFVVRDGGDQQVLPGCIMTFAYWNADFLRESRLLNPQTGEFLAVDVQPMPAITLEVRGEEVAANRYRLTARGIELELWYSESNEWLGLESVAKGGRLLRYERIFENA